MPKMLSVKRTNYDIKLKTETIEVTYVCADDAFFFVNSGNFRLI